MDIETIYDLHVQKVYKFFAVKSLNKSLAEDLTSQTFMLLVERMQVDEPQIEDHKKFLYGIMRNVWLMHLRKKYQQAELSIESIDDFEAYIEEEVSEYETLTVKQRAEVFVKQLPKRQQQVVGMRLLEDKSIKDIAEYLDKDRNYVKTTFKRGLKRLKELVAECPPVMEQRKEHI